MVDKPKEPTFPSNERPKTLIKVNPLTEFLSN